MDDKIIQPFDQTELNQTIELMIRSSFKKEKGGMVNVNSQLYLPPGAKCEASIMAYILISGLTIWAQNVSRERGDSEMAIEQATRILPVTKELHKIIQFVNPDMEIKNLISQLNDDNANNKTGVSEG